MKRKLLFLLKFLVDHLLKLSEYLGLPLLSLLLAEHGERALLVRAVDLVLLPQTHGLHPAVTGSGHHPPVILVPGNNNVSIWTADMRRKPTLRFHRW